jgi:O-antigen/teichoic acid export membrane protein
VLHKTIETGWQESAPSRQRLISSEPDQEQSASSLPDVKTKIIEMKNRLGRSGVGAKLARGSMEAFVVRIAGTLLSFLMALLLSRAMGVGEYGVYIYAVSWLQLLVLPAKMGMDSVLVRFVSGYREVENWASFSGLLCRSLRLTLLSSSVVIACFLGAIYLLLWHTNNALAITMAFGAIVLAIEPIIGLRQASLRAMGHIALATFVLTILRPLFIIAIAGLALLLRPELISSFSMIGVYAAASLVGLVVVELLSRRRLPSQVLDTRRS